MKVEVRVRTPDDNPIIYQGEFESEELARLMRAFLQRGEALIVQVRK